MNTWRKSTNRVDKAGEQRQAVSVGWRSEQGDPSEMENYQDKKDEKDDKDFQRDNLGEMNNATHLEWENAQMTIGQQQIPIEPFSLHVDT